MKWTAFGFRRLIREMSLANPLWGAPLGSIRRECLDHLVVFSERHLRHVLRSYAEYYNATRTHLSVGKDAPIPRAVQDLGTILPVAVLGGLHHHYVRI